MLYIFFLWLSIILLFNEFYILLIFLILLSLILLYAAWNINKIVFIFTILLIMYEIFCMAQCRYKAISDLRDFERRHHIIKNN